MENQIFLTEREVAARLKCSVPAMRVWRRQGMPALHFGRLVRFRLDDVLCWFEQREQKRNGYKNTESETDDTRS